MKRKPLITLILLLLAGAAIFFVVHPRWIAHQREAQAQRLMKSAYQIHQALFAYASSHNQMLPHQTAAGADFTSSNEAFRQLFITGVLDQETLFFAAGTPWCSGNQPDGAIGNRGDHFAAAVAPGENFWGYRPGLMMERDAAAAPLLMDGFTAERMMGKPDRSSAKDSAIRLVLRLGGSVGVVWEDGDEKLKAELGPARILLPQLPP